MKSLQKYIYEFNIWPNIFFSFFLYFVTPYFTLNIPDYKCACNLIYNFSDIKSTEQSCKVGASGDKDHRKDAPHFII